MSSEGVVRGLERGAAAPHPKARLAILDARWRLAQLAGAECVVSSRAHGALACLAVRIFRQQSAMHVTLHKHSSACHPVLIAQQFCGRPAATSLKRGPQVTDIELNIIFSDSGCLDQNVGRGPACRCIGPLRCDERLPERC